MNRRHLGVIALVIAVPLFAAPLVSPVPDYGPHLEVEVADEPVTFSTDKAKENRLGNPMRYQKLSASTQRLFERAYKHNEVTVRLDEAPESWTTIAPKSKASERVYVRKDGQYYRMELRQFTPGPSFQAFMLRLGPFLGAIGLGTLAGYFVFTAEE